MLEAFYSHLEEKSANDSELRLLRAQWDFDKLLLESALQHVGGVFRHYSKHDSSHSRKILVNIAKLLGNKLKLLSATDTWLIMEGAFWHDTGMLTSDEEVIKTIKTPEFTSFIRGIARDKNHELNYLALQYNSDDPLWYFKKADNPTAAVDQWYQLLATWYRGQHASRSSYTVLHPETRGIDSKRSSLIPQRLLRCLSKICRMHTAPFDHIRVELQQFEDGMSNELCHPRFVACLLRLGDLLDMDNGRFCPVMAALHGKGPRSKAAHLDKHESIVHLRCSEQFIEAHAECETDEGYLATSDWFAMLEKEAEKQLKAWDEIVPSPGFMSIPVVKVELRHKDTDFLLHGGRLPKLSLSENEVFEILQGADIYKHKWQSLRELLQNAEDATLVRLWLCHEGEIREGGMSPLSESFLELVKKYPIVIKLNKTPDKNGNTILHVVIEDKGCGISRETFEKMLSVGSSKDVTLQNVIDGMPEWLKPSGAFGLGLQSAFFMGAQQLEFSTRSLLDNSSAHITIPSQLGLGGFAKYKAATYKPGADYGCTLSFLLSYRDDFAENVREHFFHKNSYHSSLFRYGGMKIIIPDPLKEKDNFLHDPVLQAIFFEIKNFSKGCFSHIELDYDGKKRPLDKIQRDSSNYWFDFHNNIVISKIPDCIDYEDFFHSPGSNMYRGQPMRLGRGVNWIGDVDVLYGNAKQALSISRNNIKSDFEKKVSVKINESIFEYICENYSNMNNVQRQYVSLHKNNIENSAKKVFPKIISSDDFKNIVFNREERNINDLLCGEDFILYYSGNLDYEEDFDKNFLSYESFKKYSTFRLSTLYFMVDFLLKKNLYVKSITPNNAVLLFSKNRHDSAFDDSYLCSEIERIITGEIFRDHRISILCPDIFTELTVKIPQFGVISIYDVIADGNRMIIPYELINEEREAIKREDIDLYVNWVFANSIFEDKPEKDSIRKKYYEFIKYFENIVMLNSEKWKEVFISEPITDL